MRKLVVPLQRLNVITGANGSGKSSLYRALRLLGDTAQGRVIPSLAREGGLQSTLWAGPESISRSVKRGDYPVQGTRRDEPITLSLGFASDEFGYLIDLGLPAAGTTAFGLDPVVKVECVWHGPVLRPSTMLAERRGPLVRLRAQNGDWDVVKENLSPFDVMMTQVADPRNAPEMLTLRESIRAWRFYDHFRTDQMHQLARLRSVRSLQYFVTMEVILRRLLKRFANLVTARHSIQQSMTLSRAVVCWSKTIWVDSLYR